MADVDTGGAWVVAPKPIAPLKRVAEVTARLSEAAHRARRRVRFFAVEDHFLDLAPAEAIRIGEQPVCWDRRNWS